MRSANGLFFTAARKSSSGAFAAFSPGNQCSAWPSRLSHLAPLRETERLAVSPEPQDFRDVDVAGHLHIIRQSFKPARAPVRAKRFFHLRAPALFNRGDRLRNLVVKLQRRDVLVKIRRLGHAAAQGVHLRPVQAIKVVELHRRERGGERLDLFAGLLQFAALVVRADDEHAHVQFVRGGHGGPVQVVDEIPVQVDVIEFAAVHRLQNDVCGGVRGKADEPAAALPLQLPRRLQAAARLQRPVEQLAVVDAVQREQVHMVQLQVSHRSLERLQKLRGRRLRRDLRLHDHLVARQLGQQCAELHLRRAVAARRLNVVDAQRERAVDAGLEIFLVRARDVRRRHILPFVLVTHPAAGDDGQLEIGPAKAAIFHGGENSPAPTSRQAARIKPQTR